MPHARSSMPGKPVLSVVYSRHCRVSSFLGEVDQMYDLENCSADNCRGKQAKATWCRQQAEPRVLLACINPAEAALVDGASGVHMRLRLNGDTWPPRLMYRVYLHSTVAHVTALTSGAAAPETEGGMPPQGLAPCWCNCCMSVCTTTFHSWRSLLELTLHTPHAAAGGLNRWRAVRMGTSLSSMMQQWRAARARARIYRPNVSYPPLVPARQQVARGRVARQQRMLQMYHRHCTENPEMDEDAAVDDMLDWCSELRIADYFECVPLCTFVLGYCYACNFHACVKEVHES